MKSQLRREMNEMKWQLFMLSQPSFILHCIMGAQESSRSVMNVAVNTKYSQLSNTVVKRRQILSPHTLSFARPLVTGIFRHEDDEDVKSLVKNDSLCCHTYMNFVISNNLLIIPSQTMCTTDSSHYLSSSFLSICSFTDFWSRMVQRQPPSSTVQ